MMSLQVVRMMRSESQLGRDMRTILKFKRDSTDDIQAANLVTVDVVADNTSITGENNE